MFWRHVVASASIDEHVPAETAGSEAYQEEHMGLIFEEGLSFSGFERDRVFLGDGTGNFLDLSAISGADHVGDGRALVVADFDDDGDPDVFLHNIQRERHALFRNDVGHASGHGFVKVRLTGTSGARDAAGAVVRLARDDGASQAQVHALGSGFVSQNAPELVFGLGDAAGGRLSVTWPGGRLEDFGRVEAGARVRLVEGGTVKTVAPRRFVLPDPLPPGLKIGMGERMADLAALDAEGKPGTLALQSEGETLLNIWATHCSTCIREIPDLQTLHEREGTRVVGLSVDHPSQYGKAVEVMAKRGGEYPLWFVETETLLSFADPERLSIPTTLRLGPDGTILEILRGPVHP